MVYYRLHIFWHIQILVQVGHMYLGPHQKWGQLHREAHEVFHIHNCKTWQKIYMVMILWSYIETHEKQEKSLGAIHNLRLQFFRIFTSSLWYSYLDKNPSSTKVGKAMPQVFYWIISFCQINKNFKFLINSLIWKNCQRPALNWFCKRNLSLL